MHPASNLGAHLGRNDREHVLRWSRAMTEAKQRPDHPRRCEVINKRSSDRCRNIAVRGSKCCRTHISLDDFVRLDAKRRVQDEVIVETSKSFSLKKRAARRLKAMDNRALKYAWTKIDPRTPGALIEFQHPSHRAQCEDWLAGQGYPIDQVSPVSGELPSARCIDRCYWAAMRCLIKENIDEAKAMVSVRAAHDADAKFFAKLRAADAKADADR